MTFHLSLDTSGSLADSPLASPEQTLRLRRQPNSLGDVKDASPLAEPKANLPHRRHLRKRSSTLIKLLEERTKATAEAAIHSRQSSEDIDYAHENGGPLSIDSAQSQLARAIGDLSDTIETKDDQIEEMVNVISELDQELDEADKEKAQLRSTLRKTRCCSLAAIVSAFIFGMGVGISLSRLSRS